MTSSIPVTLLYGGLNALLLVALGLNVSRIRIAKRVLAGAAQPPELTLPVRAHGNAAEWIPLGTLLLLLLELSRAGTSFTLHLLGGAFLLARVLHAIGMLGRSRIGVAGAIFNYVVVAAMAVCVLAHHFAR